MTARAPGVTFQIGTHQERLDADPIAGLEWRESDTGLVYRGDGDDWLIWNAVGQIRKTADTELSNIPSTARVDITDMAIPVEPNEKWQFTAILDLLGSSINADFNWSMSAPPGATWKFQTQGNVNGVAVGTTSPVLLTNPAGSIGTGAVASNFAVVLYGWVTAGANRGVAQLKGSQHTQLVESTKVLAGSLLIPRRML